MFPVNVRNITPKSERANVTIITSNAMPKHGVSKTDIRRQHVLFHSMLMILVRVTVLCIKVVKPTMTVPVKKPVIPKPVRQAKNCMPADAVLMITHMVHVADRLAARRIRL